jgi:hypothetical protein
MARASSVEKSSERSTGRRSGSMGGTMKRWRLLTGLALMAGSIVWGSVATVQALPPGTSPTGGQTISPTSGDAATEITLGVTAPNNVCPGDTVTGNYRWNMYVADAAVDAGTVTWTPGSSGAPTAPGGGFIQPMFSRGAGSGQLAKSTAIDSGQIVGVQTVDFLTNTIPGNGSYKVGFSCTKPPALGQPAATERFWQTTINVTGWVSPTQFTWSTGMPPPPPPPPPPPTGLQLSPGLGDSSTEMTLSLTSPDNVCPGDTATGNYRWNTFMAPSSVDVGTLTYNNQGPISPAAGVTVRPLFTAIGGSSLVNRSTAVQTGQIVGTSTVSFAVFGPGDIAPGSYKIGYACTKPPALGQPAQTERFWQVQIVVTQSATGGPAQIAWSSGTPPPPPSSVTQTITATKAAAAALIIQQRCGVFGPLPAVIDPDLGSLPALPGALPGVPGTGPSAQCGVDLGTTTLVAIGPRQGQFYGTTGRINQIDVFDTRPGNRPWTVSAQISRFTNGGLGLNDSFSSNLLGWQPEVTTARTPDGNIDFSVVPGFALEPSADPSDGQARTLATAFPGKTAGFVQLDARLKLLIPATASNGRYSATITFTVI